MSLWTGNLCWIGAQHPLDKQFPCVLVHSLPMYILTHGSSLDHSLPMSSVDRGSVLDLCTQKMLKNCACLLQHGCLSVDRQYVVLWCIPKNLQQMICGVFHAHSRCLSGHIICGVLLSFSLCLFYHKKCLVFVGNPLGSKKGTTKIEVAHACCSISWPNQRI